LLIAGANGVADVAKPPQNRTTDLAAMLRAATVVNRDPTRSMFGDVVLLVFLLAQCLDGVLTYVGISTFGEAIEANPLLAWYIAMFGPAVALIGAKAVAVACAAALHFCARHRTVGVLALVYLAAAVWPWTQIIWN
jgi:uncharacterized membrane protein